MQLFTGTCTHQHTSPGSTTSDADTVHFPSCGCCWGPAGAGLQQLAAAEAQLGVALPWEVRDGGDRGRAAPRLDIKSCFARPCISNLVPAAAEFHTTLLHPSPYMRLLISASMLWPVRAAFSPPPPPASHPPTPTKPCHSCGSCTAGGMGSAPGCLLTLHASWVSGGEAGHRTPGHGLVTVPRRC